MRQWNKELSDKIESRFGEPVVYPLFAYFDSANMLYNAIEKVGPSSEDIKRELKSQPYQGIVGKYQFDDEGNSLNQVYITQIQNGKLKLAKIEME